MKQYLVLLLTSVAIKSAAIAADSEDRAAPIDQGPAACLDRDVNAASASCIVRPDGSRSDIPPRALSDIPGYNDDNRKTAPAATTPAEGPSAVRTDR